MKTALTLALLVLTVAVVLGATVVGAMVGWFIEYSTTYCGEWCLTGFFLGGGIGFAASFIIALAFWIVVGEVISRHRRSATPAPVVGRQESPGP